MIHGNTNHPVIVKRIPIRVWTLRDEIYFALSERQKAAPSPDQADYSDIQAFYCIDEGGSSANKAGGGKQDEGIEDILKSALDEGAEGPGESGEGAELEAEDDDMAAMMDALQQNEEEEEEGEGEEEAEPAAEEVSEGEGPEQEEQQQEEEVSQEAGSTSFKRRPPPKKYIVDGYVFLQDITMNEIILFTRKLFVQGQTIVIKLDIPNGFTFSASVVKTFDHQTPSRIISEKKPGYRIQARVTFRYPGERTHMRNFLKSIQPDIPIKLKTLE